MIEALVCTLDCVEETTIPIPIEAKLRTLFGANPSANDENMCQVEVTICKKFDVDKAVTGAAINRFFDTMLHKPVHLLTILSKFAELAQVEGKWLFKFFTLEIPPKMFIKYATNQVLLKMLRLPDELAQDFIVWMDKKRSETEDDGDIQVDSSFLATTFPKMELVSANGSCKMNRLLRSLIKPFCRYAVYSNSGVLHRHG